MLLPDGIYLLSLEKQRLPEVSGDQAQGTTTDLHENGRLSYWSGQVNSCRNGHTSELMDVLPHRRTQQHRIQCRMTTTGRHPWLGPPSLLQWDFKSSTSSLPFIIPKWSVTKHTLFLKHTAKLLRITMSLERKKRLLYSIGTAFRSEKDSLANHLTLTQTKLSTPWFMAQAANWMEFFLKPWSAVFVLMLPMAMAWETSQCSLELLGILYKNKF